MLTLGFKGLSHKMSSAHTADFKANIFGRTICTLSFVVKALIFSEF